MVEWNFALNAAVGDLESGRRMARAFGRAGGDIFELNVHGEYGKLIERGLIKAMALPANQPTLIRWLRELAGLEVQLVVKFDASTDGVDWPVLMDEVSQVEGLFGIHFNVRSGNETPDVAFVERIRPHVGGVLFCSGHVRTSDQVRALFDAGADCVGLAQGVLDEPGIIARLAAELDI